LNSKIETTDSSVSCYQCLHVLWIWGWKVKVTSPLCDKLSTICFSVWCTVFEFLRWCWFIL